ncbi:MAG: hypothetical protein L3J35_09395 [Bacteroidales bacterium]|nr:hypothetical protein [Bacteroidales bacterium]
MKKIIAIIILFCLSITTYSQNYKQRLDSLEFEIKKIEKKQTNIVNQIDLHQKRYRTGVFVSLSGTFITVISAVVINPNNPMYYVGTITGSILGVSGCFISLNSFKFLKKDFDYIDFSKSRYDTNKTSRYDMYKNE